METLVMFVERFSVLRTGMNGGQFKAHVEHREAQALNHQKGKSPLEQQALWKLLLCS